MTQETILEEIREGRTQMRPRWYFVLKAALAGTGVGIAVLAAVYFESFIVFLFHSHGPWFGPTVGLHALLVAVPWAILVATLVFIVLLEVLVRRYSFAYRRPLLITVGGIVLLVALAGFFVERSGFHRVLWERAQHGRLPFAGALYRHYHGPLESPFEFHHF